MLNTKTHLAVIALVCLSVACTKDQAPQAPPPPVNNVVLREVAPLGQVLTDSVGRTLYFYTKDTTGNSVCTGGCRDAWPIFYTPTVRLGAGLTAGDFGTITRTDGALQTTYKGWPLYYYKVDAAAGEAKGENVGCNRAYIVFF
jgi:predicted lipoprotein with Yx(FWY)xxD motif